MIPVELQVIGAGLRAIAEEMGAVLIRSAFSANIKERRDCSTALFDETGRMVTQAEHIPVHLGAMPEAVAAVRAHDPAPGEPWILNDPYAGGTHLPDLTIVTRTMLGYAVTRAHHADVGGSEPGSLPAGSETLAEEGVVIPPTRLDSATLEGLVAQMRNADERRGDLRAQLAAHHLAERRIDELCVQRGRTAVAAAMEELLAYSERVVRAGIRILPDGRYEAADALETSAGLLELRAAVTILGDEVEIDFDGTAPQHAGNLNCPLAVTRSACFYVVRCLTAPDLPASGGAFEPVAVRAPAGCLVNARPPAAVAAGNTETSSRIVDLVFAAFGAAVPVPAQGQGTMNNVVFGNDRFTYYETIAGGQGACPNADGPSAVHVAMSNTLNTPIEALELAYPLRVERYELRAGSGGAGRQRGGDGVVRELRALEPCRLSLLTQRRALAPRGTEGGGDGLPGRNLLNGAELPAFATLDLAGRRSAPDRDAGRRRLGYARLTTRRKPVEHEALVLVEHRQVERPFIPRSVDDEVLSAVTLWNGEVAGSQEPTRVPSALVRSIVFRVGDVPRRRDGDEHRRERGQVGSWSPGPSTRSTRWRHSPAPHRRDPGTAPSSGAPAPDPSSKARRRRPGPETAPPQEQPGLPAEACAGERPRQARRPRRQPQAT